MRAAAAARAGRATDALTQRNLARSAAARGNDPVAAELVAFASVEIARAAGDLPAELDALREIEKLLIARFGEASVRVGALRFLLGSKLQVANDPTGDALVQQSIKLLGRLMPSTQASLVGLDEIAPVRRVPIDRQLIALARATKSADLPNHLAGLSFDCFLVLDYECALASASEAFSLLPPGQDRENLIDDAAAYSLESALVTEDKAKRRQRLEHALALLEQLSPAARETDSAHSTRGRTLLASGRPKDAIGPLSIALDVAERAEKRHAFRILVRSFTLAQALWLGGGESDRDRARMLVDQAIAAIPKAREMLNTNKVQQGNQMARLDKIIDELTAWKRTHD
jgi:tetratricopeptide (TPR) repeat protein